MVFPLCITLVTHGAAEGERVTQDNYLDAFKAAKLVEFDKERFRRLDIDGFLQDLCGIRTTSATICASFKRVGFAFGVMI